MSDLVAAPSGAVRRRVSMHCLLGVSLPTLALFLSVAPAQAQFICQQYGGMGGNAVAGNLALACGTDASAGRTVGPGHTRRARTDIYPKSCLISVNASRGGITPASTARLD